MQDQERLEEERLGERGGRRRREETPPESGGRRPRQGGHDRPSLSLRQRAVVDVGLVLAFVIEASLCWHLILFVEFEFE